MALTAQDKQWQKEDDARVLAQAEEIRSSASRLKGAKSAASKMAKEQESRANAMKKVASGKVSKPKAATKSTTKRTTRAKKK